jgi:methionine synthase / methylenetetrahydrofolate reductase (NADH)
MPREDLLDALAARPIVSDGAMGTLLYESGHFINQSFDEANLSRPDRVLACHRSYVEAGAQLIQTNTFSANRFLLARYGAADRVEDINRAGVALARRAAGDEAWVAGSVGPTGEGVAWLSATRQQEIREAFAEQIRSLVDEGVDALLLETFHGLGEMQLAMEVAREHFDGPLISQMSFTEKGQLRDGTAPAEVARQLGDWGADVVGVNCALGPAHVFEVAQAMVGEGRPVIAQPNAGLPRRLDERTIYMSTPEYFGVFARRFFKAGVRVVGGCCGTRPEHIERVRDACRMMGGAVERDARESRIVVAAEAPKSLPPVPQAEKSGLAAKVERVWRERIDPQGPRKAVQGPEDFVVSVEVNPHPGLGTDRAIEGARLLRDHGVDVINIADGPRAVVRMANWALGLEIKRQLDMEFILHVCCRDRNLLGLQSDLLGVHVLGVRNLVVITGDPPKLGDYPKATAVFDLDSIELLKLVDSLNHGVDPAGKVFDQTTAFFSSCGAEPGSLDYDREIERLASKVDAGAEMIMTQPVYDPGVLDRFLADTADLGVPVLVGILPLASARNAEFLHNEVPGMQIPEAIRERMHGAGSGTPAREEGIRIAREMLEAVQDRVVGAYVMPPFSRYRSALEVLEVLGYPQPS